MLTIPAKVIATSFALLTFAATVLAGVAVGNSSPTILWRATLAMLCCYVVGRLAGAVAQRTIYEHIRSYKERNPIEPVEAGVTDADPAQSGA